MKWIVGVDVTEGHEGPLQLAAWLHRVGFTERGGELVGVHALPRIGLVAAALSADEREQVRSTARASLDALLATSRAGGAVPSLEIIEADTIEMALTDEATRLGADTLVVGRRARRGEAPFVRLGPVARGLLRSLPRAVVVSPPDLGERGSGDGPLVLATDMGEHAADAASFTKALARVLDRRIMVVHVVPTVGFALDYLRQKYDALTRASEHERGAELRAWAHAQGIEPAALVVLHGEPVREICKAARAHDAAMVVTGSRRLSVAERVFDHSLSTELAAACWCPVAVVPTR